MEDVKIIELFLLRSEQAIVELSYKYGGICRKIAFNILNNLEDTEECVNDTYLGVWNSIPPQKPNPFVTYVCKIARNVSLKKYRYNTAKRRNGFYDVSLSELEDCIPTATQDSRSCSDEDLSRIIGDFLDSLDKKSRIMFVKRYWYAESIKEISEEFGRTENYISVKLLRIRGKMKIYLENKGVIL